MKQRFSSLDIKIIAHELSKSLHSLRVVNIYDLSSRIFLFKFAKTDHREQLVVDSGFRCHLTSFGRATASAPSTFVTRLRKFLKTRRVTSVSQVGTDRIIEITFSEGQYRLFLEFYAGGNIVLCDQSLKVLALLRNVEEGAEHEHIRLGSQYDLSHRNNIAGIPPLDVARIHSGLEAYISRQSAAQKPTNKRNKQKSGDLLRKSLAGCLSEYPPMLLEHALLVAGFDISLTPERVIEDEALLQAMVNALQEAERISKQLLEAETVSGFIFGKLKANAELPEKSEEGLSNEQLKALVMYNDFHPFKPQQLIQDESVRVLEFQGFNKTVDEFYSSIEGQKLEFRLQEREEHAKQKMDQARQDQAKRLDGLQQAQRLNVRKAQAIEANLERVNEAMDAINGLIAQGMDWVEIDQLIELEKKRRNPVAEAIKIPLKLNENTATLLLDEWNDDDETLVGDQTDSEPSDSEDEENQEEKRTKKGGSITFEDKRLAIDIDLALSAYANAREYYDQKRTAASKEEKTRLASTKALRSAQRKIEADLNRALKQEKPTLRPVRKQFWFEKFIYFISSDGYLVLGPRDSQQHELLYRKHLKRGDVYVHADLQGAAPMIIKNKSSTPDAPIPPSTLSQAGNFSVCTSAAWDSKAVMAAWWVEADQVSQTHESGQYLGPGGFTIRGNKNFLPPAQLLLGFAVIFQISESSKANHTKHRVNVDDSPSKGSDRQAIQTTSAPEDDVDEEIHDHTDDDELSNAEGDNSDQGDDTIRQNPLQSSQATDGHALAADASDEEGHGQATAPNDAVDPETYEEEDDDGHDANEADSNDIQSETTNSPAGTKVQEDREKSTLPVRGKRGKKKKIAAKYADQDEEDRAEAMRLLGSTAGQERAAQAAEARRAREVEEEESKQRRREQHLRNQKKAQEREAAKLNDTAGNADADRDDADDLPTETIDLETLVGTPLQGDDIMEAIPVCAPWTALSRFKYKAKLQPGAQKKGKAVREILGRWAAAGANRKILDERSMDVERIWPREVELLKSWKETEVLNVVPVGKMRVMMPGVNNAASGKDSGRGGKGASRGGKGSKKSR